MTLLWKMYKIRKLFHKIQTCYSRHSKGIYPWRTTAHPSRDHIQICDHNLICSSAERTTRGRGHKHYFCYSIQLRKALWKNYITSASVGKNSRDQGLAHQVKSSAGGSIAAAPVIANMRRGLTTRLRSNMF